MDKVERLSKERYTKDSSEKKDKETRVLTGG
jgi:hypothetical protein